MTNSIKFPNISPNIASKFNNLNARDQKLVKVALGIATVAVAFFAKAVLVANPKVIVISTIATATYTVLSKRSLSKNPEPVETTELPVNEDLSLNKISETPSTVEPAKTTELSLNKIDTPWCFLETPSTVEPAETELNEDKEIFRVFEQANW